jgi:hypothetical protein
VALAVQGNNFEEVESKMNISLQSMLVYYLKNHLKPNIDKTQTCAFHLRNRQAKRKLKIIWQGKELEHTTFPKYLGVTLDRSLTFKQHCENTRQKINARNSLIRRLTGSTWGANPHTLRVSALSLCFSVGEFASPAWSRSTHVKQVDVALNESCRLITGCLKNTPLKKIFPLAGIAPPDIRHGVKADWERTKQKHDKLHPMFGISPPTARLKSRKSFLMFTQILERNQDEERIDRWKHSLDKEAKNWMEPAEHLPAGNNLEWPVWRTLNRLRVGVGRCKENQAKWGFIPDEDRFCDCGQTQTMAHLINCPSCSTSCTMDDIMSATEEGIEVAKFWQERI